MKRKLTVRHRRRPMKPRPAKQPKRPSARLVRKAAARSKSEEGNPKRRAWNESLERLSANPEHGKFIRDALRRRLVVPPPSYPKPDSSRMPLVWKAWHALPESYDACLRRSCLKEGRTLPTDSEPSGSPCPKFGPEDAALLEAAEWWHRFIREDYMRVFGYFDSPDGKRRSSRLGRVKRQIQFQDNNSRGLDDIATYRVAHELVERQSLEFWKLSDPSWSVVELARCRWAAYRAARVAAQAELVFLVWPGELSEFLSPADAESMGVSGIGRHRQVSALANELTHGDKERLADPTRMADYLASEFWKLPSYQQEGFLNRTQHHPNLRAHWRFALRCGAGLVSQLELRDFMLTDFVRFSLDEKLRFMRCCRKHPTAQKKNALTLMRVWLADNAPVFAKFGWHWEMIHQEVIERFKQWPSARLPKTPTLLKEYCSRNGVRLGLRSAPVRDMGEVLHRPHRRLLTDLPPVTFR